MGDALEQARHNNAMRQYNNQLGNVRGQIGLLQTRKRDLEEHLAKQLTILEQLEKEHKEKQAIFKSKQDEVRTLYNQYAPPKREPSWMEWLMGVD
jgi:chromosome segregation ATPase